MPAITLAKNGKRYTHEEWINLINTGEAETLLSRYGPGYTDEAWAKHHLSNVDSLRKNRKGRNRVAK